MPRVQTLQCPGCGQAEIIDLTRQEYDDLRSAKLIQEALPKRSSDVRERFLSGYCPKCWEKMFGEPGEEGDDGRPPIPA